MAPVAPAKTARTRKRLGFIGDTLDPASDWIGKVTGPRLTEPDGRPDPWRRIRGEGLERGLSVGTARRIRSQQTLRSGPGRRRPGMQTYGQEEEWRHNGGSP